MSRRTRTPATIEAEIADAHAARRAAEVDLGRLAAARPALLLDTTKAGDAALDAYDAAAAKTRRALERADAQIDRLRSELEAAREIEAQAERRAAYAKGQAAAAEYERLVREVYGPAAQAIAEALPAMAAALAVVDEANRGVPYAEHIDADAFRHPPFTPEPRPPATVEADVWVDADGMTCPAPMRGRDAEGRTLDGAAKQERRTIPNPALGGWTPSVRQFAQKILGRVGLPGADDSYWLVRPL